MNTHLQTVEKIRDDIATHFTNNLLSILLYGSSIKHKEYWDLDILVILKDKLNVTGDLEFLKIIFENNRDVSLDLQLFYQCEVNDPDTFSLDAHGAFFVSILAQADILYGINPFTTQTPKQELVIISLLNRIQRYIFQARQEFLGVGRYNKDKNPNYHKKHLYRTIYDLMLMIRPCEDTEDALALFKQTYPDTFTDKEYTLIETSGGNVADFMELYEKIYSIALSISQNVLAKNR